MGPLFAGVIAALAGAGLAVVGALGLVTSQTATPDPVDKPLVVYGER